MDDLHKVIRGLECCYKGVIQYCGDCPYVESPDADLLVCTGDVIADAISLLKELQPKKRESMAMLPCVCGCKRREHWYGGDDPDKVEKLKCSHCGFTAYGKNAKDVIRNWNKAVKWE